MGSTPDILGRNVTRSSGRQRRCAGVRHLHEPVRVRFSSPPAPDCPHRGVTARSTSFALGSDREGEGRRRSHVGYGGLRPTPFR